MVTKSTLLLIKKRTASCAFTMLLCLYFLQSAYASHHSVQLNFESQPASIQDIEIVDEKLNIFRVQVLGYNSQPLENEKVFWEVNNKSIEIIEADQQTNKDGFSIIKLKIPPDSNGVLTSLLSDGSRKVFSLTTKNQYQFQDELKPDKSKEIEANGIEAVTISAHITNQDNEKNARGGTIFWELQDNAANALLSATQSTSNLEGKASVEVRASKTGTAKLVGTIKASDNSTDSDLHKTITLSFKKNYHLGLRALYTEKNESQKNNPSYRAVTVSAELKDTENKPIANKDVFWRLQDTENTGAILTNTKVKTSPEGKSSVIVRAFKNGSVNLAATIYNNDNLNQLERLATTIILGSDDTFHPLELINNNAEANGSDSVTVNAKLTDGSGKGINNEEIIWTLLRNSADASIPKTTRSTNFYGETEIQVKASRAGSVVIKAVPASQLSSPPLVQTKQINFVKNYNVGLASLNVNKSVAKGDGEDTINGNGNNGKLNRRDSQQ